MPKKKLPDKIQDIQEDKQRIIGDRISLLSHEKNMTIDDLAQKIGVSSEQIKKYRGGTSATAIGTLFRLAEDDIFDCDVDYLLGILPQDQKRYTIHNLHDITGLDPAASDKLLTSLTNDFSGSELSWFINNGLLDILKRIMNLSFEVIQKQVFFNSLPKYARDKVLTISKQYAEYNELSREGEREVALFIKELNAGDIKKLDSMLSDYDIDTIPYNMHYNYYMALATAEVLSEQPISPSNNQKDRINHFILVEREALPLSRQMETDDLINKEELSVFRSLLYKKFVSIAVDYIRIDFMKDMSFFKISEMFNDMAKRYVADETMQNEYSDLIKETLFYKGDEK